MSEEDRARARILALSEALDRASDVLETLSPEELDDDVQVYRRLDGLITEAASLIAGCRTFPPEW